MGERGNLLTLREYLLVVRGWLDGRRRLDVLERLLVPIRNYGRRGVVEALDGPGG